MPYIQILKWTHFIHYTHMPILATKNEYIQYTLIFKAYNAIKFVAEAKGIKIIKYNLVYIKIHLYQFRRFLL